MLVSIIYTVLLLLLSPYAIWFIAKRKQKRGEPPIVPFWIPWLGSGLTYQKDPIAFLKKQTKKYGPIFTVFMGGNYFTFVTDPFTHPLVAKEGKILNFRICTLPMIKHLFDYQRPAVEEPTMGGLFVKYLQGQRLNVMIEKMMKCLQRIMLAGKYTNTDWSEVGLLHFVESIMCTASFSTLFGDYPKSSNKDIPAFEHQMFEDFRKFDEAFPYLVKGYPLNSFKGLEESRKNFWKHLASDELNKREMVSDLIAEYARICDAEKDRTLPKKLFSTAWAAQ
uniref:Cytochrome P450 n=1 Tax=Ciona savignyi TaxID=51511 RepID=H2YXF3_CIOSA